MALLTQATTKEGRNENPANEKIPFKEFSNLLSEGSLGEVAPGTGRVVFLDSLETDGSTN